MGRKRLGIFQEKLKNPAVSITLFSQFFLAVENLQQEKLFFCFNFRFKSIFEFL